ncbi:hypothetical protein B296_00007611 [Ensete ventricosum]|uniref:Uncharacterized protein n=1 Tax=Ensete ventricosum TaxID=4639 RepID=A0A427B169_ENSVE|nr:hypothetical protein B296_00007611 [Ensete ventricosum]
MALATIGERHTIEKGARRIQLYPKQSRRREVLCSYVNNKSYLDAATQCRAKGHKRGDERGIEMGKAARRRKPTTVSSTGEEEADKRDKRQAAVEVVLAAVREGEIEEPSADDNPFLLEQDRVWQEGKQQQHYCVRLERKTTTTLLGVTIAKGDMSCDHKGSSTISSLRKRRP